jgi:hypothetical protein
LAIAQHDLTSAREHQNALVAELRKRPRNGFQRLQAISNTVRSERVIIWARIRQSPVPCPQKWQNAAAGAALSA